MLKFTLTISLLLTSVLASSQVVINELDADTPSTDIQEFVELRSDVPFYPLQGYVLVFYNGSSTSSTGLRSYYTIGLDDYTTDVNGLLLIGNVGVSPVPDVIFSDNLIQNGPDAVALYLGSAADFPHQTLAHSNNLVDALAHGTSDPYAVELMELLGLTVQIDENLHNQATNHSIQRRDDGTYEVKTPTPGAHNNGSGVIFNGVTISTSVQDQVDEGSGFTIEFTTTYPVESALEFPFTLEEGNFTAADYTGNTTVFIPAGGTTFSAHIQIVDDHLDEGDEKLRIRFGALPDGFKRLNDDVELYVIDNDWTVAGFGTPLAPTYGMVTPQIPEGYYDALEGKAGQELFTALQNIIADPFVYRAHTYGDVTLILNDADQNPLHSNEVWLMYVEQGRAKYKFQTTASSIGSWNREHIFPQSRGGFANGTSTYADGIDVYVNAGPNDLWAGHSDAHHIRAEDGPENSSRNNRDYGGTDYNGPAGNQGSWRGDVARSLFYMAVRYNGLSLVNGNPPDTTPGVMGDLSYLLSWNTLDPADDFEMNRNNIVYQWQRNRNPFIDYPQLADYLWGENLGQPWYATLSTDDFSAQAVRFYPNPASDRINISGMNSGTAEIYSITGALLRTEQVSGITAIELNLPSGIYILKTVSKAQTKVQKLIVR